VPIHRKLAVTALAFSASACTIWYALSDPYDGLGPQDGQADVQLDDATPVDSGPDAGLPALTQIATGVGAIAVFGDTLYANASGDLETCTDAACATLKPLVPVDASTPFPPGLAADDVGVFWVTGSGIWAASLDGTDAGLVIQDDNNPQVLAADGPRVSWTTQNDAGAPVIHSCAMARKGGIACKFTKPVGGPDAGSGASGSGGAVELVDAASSVDNSQLASGAGFVVWVARQGNETITYTPVDGGAWSTVSSVNDTDFAGTASTTTLIAHDGPTVVYSFYNRSGNNPFVLERSQYPANDQGAYLTSGLQHPNKSDCIGAAAGLAAYCPTANAIDLVDEDGGGSVSNIPLGAAIAPLNGVVATSAFVFVLDSQHTLFKYPRN
jgi:hypothetical protein